MTLYQRRRDQGLCVRCGQPALPNINLPAVVARHAREKGTTEAREGHYSLCKRHELEAERAKSTKAERAKSTKNATYRRVTELRAARLGEGLCVHCGKRPHEDGVQSCGECLAVQRKRYNTNKRNDGTCRRCGTQLDPADDSRIVRGERRMYGRCCQCRLIETDMQNARRRKRRRDAMGTPAASRG